MHASTCDQHLISFTICLFMAYKPHIKAGGGAVHSYRVARAVVMAASVAATASALNEYKQIIFNITNH